MNLEAVYELWDVEFLLHYYCFTAALLLLYMLMHLEAVKELCDVEFLLVSIDHPQEGRHL